MSSIEKSLEIIKSRLYNGFRNEENQALAYQLNTGTTNGDK